MTKRQEIFEQIRHLIGAPVAALVSLESGWPGIVQVTTGSGNFRVAMHVSTVGSHARKAYERRFQNPSDRHPVLANAGEIPVLVGLAQVGARPILVVVDGRSRVGRNARFSILFNESLLQEAASNGWADYTSSTGEHIFAMLPKLFPVYVEMAGKQVSLNPRDIAVAATASGATSDDTEPAAERVRVAASRLVRSAAFSKNVRQAYGGRCAICELSIGLVQGAHIFPASAPGSQDEVWNGIALCHNHHAAFDRHYLWVHPADLLIKVRPDIEKCAEEDKAVSAFVGAIAKHLRAPIEPGSKPRSEMFERRYAHFDGAYDWA